MGHDIFKIYMQEKETGIAKTLPFLKGKLEHDFYGNTFGNTCMYFKEPHRAKSKRSFTPALKREFPFCDVAWVHMGKSLF